MTRIKTSDLEFVKDLPSISEAIRVSIRLGGKKEKHIFSELGIKQSHWSLIMNEQAPFPSDKLCHFMQICENEIVLHWMAFQLGFEARIIPKTLELQLDEARKTNDELQKKIEHLNELVIRGLRSVEA